MKDLVEARNDSYLDELKEKIFRRTGKSMDDTTVARTLRRLGFTLKKVRLSLRSWYTVSHISQLTPRAIERNERKRLAFAVHMAENYRAEQLVFVDESACDRRTYFRNRAWALCGQPAYRKLHFVRGKR